MSVLKDLVNSGRIVAGHRPWPRSIVNSETWCRSGQALSDGSLSLLGLWGDFSDVHMALADKTGTQVAVLTLHCPVGRYPAISQYHPPAIRLERAIQDLFGLAAQGLVDVRPWLDHGRWGWQYPLGDSPPRTTADVAYEFLSAEGESLHQIPVGPVHAGIIEPGHFRFTASGEIVVRLEERLGYAHKGVEALMAGSDIDAAARLAGRVSGDSTVAYAWVFARAVESALGINVPDRAIWLRALMAEIERLANHLGDIGAICNDAGFALLNAQSGILREHVLRAAGQTFEHRLMMDRIVPGGLSADIDDSRLEPIVALVRFLRGKLQSLTELYDNTASLEDRTVGTGIVAGRLVDQFATGGFVGRASGRNFDARKQLVYAPYGKLSFDVPVRDAGDVNARILIRFDEIHQSLHLIEQIVDRLPSGAIIAQDRHAQLSAPGGEGLALGEGFRGDILVSVNIDRQRKIVRCHLRDPSWFQWPLLEVAMKDNIVADFPLCNKSFNCSYSGHDL